MNRKIDADIERYLAGEMDETETRELLRRLEADPARQRALQKDEAILGAMRRDRDAVSNDHVGARMRAMSALETIDPESEERIAHARRMRTASGAILVSLLAAIMIGSAAVWWSVGQPGPIDEPSASGGSRDSVQTGRAPGWSPDSIASPAQIVPPANADSSAAVATELRRSQAGPEKPLRTSAAAGRTAVENDVKPAEPPPVPVYNDTIARGSIRQDRP